MTLDPDAPTNPVDDLASTAVTPGAPAIVDDGPGAPGSEPAPTGDQPWAWHGGRAAALLLVLLVPLHFAVTFIVGDIGATTARSMAERLDDPTWRVLTWLLIALALVHAMLSTDAALRVRRPGPVSNAATVGVGVVCMLLLVAASVVLVTLG